VSMADAARARELAARVAILEERVAALEGSSPGAGTLHFGGLQGQLNSLRAKVDRLIPPGPPVSATGPLPGSPVSSTG
jgi:hypothetical protein